MRMDSYRTDDVVQKRKIPNADSHVTLQSMKHGVHDLSLWNHNDFDLTTAKEKHRIAQKMLKPCINLQKSENAFALLSTLVRM